VNELWKLSLKLIQRLMNLDKSCIFASNNEHANEEDNDVAESAT